MLIYNLFKIHNYLATHPMNCAQGFCQMLQVSEFNPIGSMYGIYIIIYIYANIGGILMVNVTIYSIHGSYGNGRSTG